MATFIGKPISLISHSDVRYRGILAGIDPNASTIQLSNVYSMGTESRRPPAQFIPPVPDPYEYIIFRASEVKDLSVDEQVAPRTSVHDDPAVLGASQRPQGAAPGFPPYGVAQPFVAAGVPPQAAQAARSAVPPVAVPPQAANANVNVQPAVSAPVRTGSVQTADASLETVGRALGDLRQRNSNNNNNGNANKLRVPQTDFDFEGSNARFEKQVVNSGSKSPEEGEAEEPKAYDPSKSFFDSLSSGSNAPGGGGGGGGSGGGGGGGRSRGRGRGGGRNRREEERERNVATFGEPGGVGLMGPGAYVGGWGGYGRRGGGRRGRGPGQAAVARS